VERGQVQIRIALAQVISGSAALQQLLNEQRKAWARLRGLRVAATAIVRACKGQFENADKLFVGVSLDPDVVNQPEDQRPITEWRTAIAALLENADAPLPNDI
jgi:hypothetical protein